MKIKLHKPSSKKLEIRDSLRFLKDSEFPDEIKNQLTHMEWEVCRRTWTILNFDPTFIIQK